MHALAPIRLRSPVAGYFYFTMRWLSPALMIILTFAPGRAVAAEPELSAELTTAAAVRMLPAEEAVKGRSVQLRGQLLLTTTQVNALVLFDGVEGIYVALTRAVDPGWRPGDVLEVVGVTDAGDFAPIVRASRVRKLGPGALPDARAVSIAELDAGGLDAAWVELRGIVRSCVPAGPVRPPAAARLRAKENEAPARAGAAKETWLLVLAQGDNRMTVQVNDRVVPERLVDAEVRLRGVVFNVHNANRQFVRATLHSANAAMVEVLVPPPADPFSLPHQQIGELLRFTREGFTGHRVHVRGIVTAHEDGRSFWVRDGERGMRIASTQPDRLRPGDEVEIVGFPDHGSYTPSLSDAIFRRTGTAPPPTPQPLRATEDISRHDSNLVQLYADLREVRTSPEGQQLVLGWGGRLVYARLLQPADDDIVASWRPGSHVRVEGICLVAQSDPFRHTGLWLPEDLQLLLRSPQDVTVMRAAPWLTTQRALRLVVLGLLLTLGALIAVAVVARRQITQREEGRKLAEVEFAAMLAERNRLAREIHDTVAQDLNAVSMQLELARNVATGREAEAIVPFLTTAHRLVRKCLAEARESIWDMRSHILERTDLAGALKSVAEQLAAGQKCTVHTEVRGRSRRLSPMVENNLLRIGQEAVANALKHARPGAIGITLDFEDEEVRLVVRDDGPGFDPASAVESAGTHFGLRGMRERAAQMGGEFQLARDPAGGMRVEVTVRSRASAPV